MSETKAYKCLKCKKIKSEFDFHKNNDPYRLRKVHGYCKECRNKLKSWAPMHHRYKYGTWCPECKKWTKTNLNGLCFKCNKKFGLKECSDCKQLLFAIQDFYPKKSECMECTKRRSLLANIL